MKRINFNLNNKSLMYLKRKMKQAEKEDLHTTTLELYKRYKGLGGKLTLVEITGRKLRSEDFRKIFR